MGGVTLEHINAGLKAMREARCGGCGVDSDLWRVNPDGGYGRPELWACVQCLKGDMAGAVQRLLDVYPQESADALREALK